MKIEIKTIDKRGGSFLIYLLTDDGVKVKCSIVDRYDLDDTIISFMGDEKLFPLKGYTYEEYINQDERK